MTTSSQSRPVPDIDHLTRDYRGLREQLIQLVTRSGWWWLYRNLQRADPPATHALGDEEQKRSSVGTIE